MDKRSYQTLEFWLSAAAFLLGAVLASGAFDGAAPDGAVAVIAKIMGTVTSILAALGYTGARIWQKVRDNDAATLLEANAANPTAPAQDPPA